MHEHLPFAAVSATLLDRIDLHVDMAAISLR